MLRLYGFVCTPAATESLDRRIDRLHPWLYATLGRDEVQTMDANLAQERGLVDPIRCPTAEERDRSLLGYRRLVGELERRSRRVRAEGVQ